MTFRASICLVVTLAAATPTRAQEQFVATMDGSQVVPPTNTSATGKARFTIQSDTAIQYELEVAYIRDVWSAGIYTGAAGTSGFKAATLFVGPASGETNGELAKGTITDRDLLTFAGVTLKGLVDLMRKGEAYVQVLTGNYPRGEIRGSVAAGT